MNKGASHRARNLPIGFGIALALVQIGLPTAIRAQEVPSQAELWRIVQQQQREIAELKARLSAQPDVPEPAAPADVAERARIESLEQRVSATEQGLEATATALEGQLSDNDGTGWWHRTSIGGYGSVRFEANDLDAEDPGFTFRRFVLALDSQITDRLEAYLELELERFTQLELEKDVVYSPGEFEVAQAIEGTNGSEIAIEQAWARYVITPGLRFDVGALLVPVGRFNINHDDNQWILPRRTLVDRGAPALPVKSAWPELGAGLSGLVELGSQSLLDYRVYVVNGATLDFELETELKAATEDSGETELESKLEAEFGPSRGGFDRNNNDSLALTGRVALRPTSAHEIALSGYYGGYVPSSLGPDETVWSLGLDGLHRIGGLELEYEAVVTRFENLDDVVAAFASRALTKERAIEGPVEDGTFAKHEIEFTLSSNAMAERKSGYWLELRYPIALASFGESILTRGFADPQLVPAFRFEQVYYDNQLTGIEFENGLLTEMTTRDAHINRATLGLGYRPTPTWLLQLAGEYTWTSEDSLAGLTNYLPAGAGEDDALALLLGIAYGF